MSHREIKSGGSLLNAATLLDRTKVYTYDASGNIVEVDGVTVTLGDNDLVFSGSKSNLRRMADLERNISILATREYDGSLASQSITASTTFTGNVVFSTSSTVDAQGVFDVSGTLGTNFTEKLQDIMGSMVTANTESGITVTYDDTLGKLNFSVTDSFVNTTGDTMSGILNMGGNLIQNLATPLISTDAASKGYVDSAVSSEVANVAQYTSWFFSDGTNLSEITDGGSLVINPGNNISIAYNATSDEYTINSTDTNTTYSAGSGLTLSGTTFSHTDTSSVTNLTASGRTYVTGLTFDTFGHVTGVSTGTETVVDTNDIDYINAASFNTSTGVLTLSGVGNAGATVDLDGRYQPKVTISGTAPTGASVGDLWYDDTTDLKIFIYTGSEWVDTVPTAQNNYVTSLAFNAGDGVLTATREGLTNLTVDLDGRYLTSETVTSLSLSSNTLSYVDENGATTNIDLSLYIDDTNLARLVSGTVNGTSGIATFTRDDASTFTIDFSALFDDTNLTRITSGSFDTADGNLTLTRSDASTAATINLDGRYQPAGSYDGYFHWSASDGTTTAAINSVDTLTFSGSGITNTSFNAITNTLTINTPAYSSGSGIDLTGTTFSHSDTSTVTTLTPASNTFVSGLNFDIYGHVTGYTTSSEVTYSQEVVLDTGGALLRLKDNNNNTDDIKLSSGNNITVAYTDANTITISSNDTNTTYSAGSGITLTGTTFSNAAPDQVVSLTGSGATSVSGTYPNFTISSNDTNTTYGTATSTVPGLVELFSNTVQSVAANAVSTTAGRTYGLQLNSAGQVVVNVPWSDTDSNTTYSVKASVQTGGAGIDLDAGGSGSGTDTVKILGSGSTTVTRTDAGTITISSTGTAYTAGAGIDITGTTFSHTDTSSVTDLIESGRTYITGLGFDAFGHVVSYTTGTESVSNSNYYPTALSFNSSTGDLTLAVTGSSDITASLDGRYLTSYTETSTLADVTARGASTTAAVTFGDVSINGNLNVLGTTTTVNQTTLTVNDSKIFLADGNPSDAIDVGVIFEYNDGTNDQSAGLFRDATDGSFAFMSTYTPTVGAVINTADASYTLGDVKAANFTGNVAWSNLTNVPDPDITVTLTGDVEGTANATMTDLGSATINVSASVPATASITLASLSVTDLTVTGTQTVNNQSTLTSDDPLFILNSSQSGEPDIGMVGAYNDGTAQYSGIFRDATDNKWKVFDGYTPTLTGSTPAIDVADASFSYATIVASTFEGALDWSNVTNKPDPQVTVTLTGDVTGSASTTLADLASGTVSIATGVSSSANLNVNSLTTTTNLIVGGNLTVSGTTTTVNTEEINLADNIVVLNSNATGTATQDAGIEIERGIDANVSLLWDETNDRWTVGSQSFVASTFIGALSGNATTATSAGKWTTARTITLGGDLTGNVSIDGSTNVTLTATVAANSVALGTDTTGNYMSGVTAGTGISVSHTPAEGSTATITHADTSSVSNVTASGRTYVTGLTFDTMGHVQTVTTGTETVTDTNYYTSAVSFNTSDGILTLTGAGGSGNLTVDLDGRYQLSGAYLTAESDTLDSVTTRGNVTSNGIEVGSVTMGDVLLDNASVTTSTTAQTPVILYSTAGYGAKIVVRARDTVSGAIHVSELLIANTSSVAVATEYGSVFTSAALATYDVDVSAGNVRLLVTSASTNSTQYNISITGM